MRGLTVGSLNSYCAGRLLRCVLARRSPYVVSTVSRLAVGRLAADSLAAILIRSVYA